MITPDASDGLANVLRSTIVALVRLDGPDLTARQLGVFLTCYLESEAQTVRGLATELDVSKPAISRALDRLSEFDLTRRKKDPRDRRSVLVRRTATGMVSFCANCEPSCAMLHRRCGLPSEPTPAGSTRQRWRALPIDGGEIPRVVASSGDQHQSSRRV